MLLNTLKLLVMAGNDALRTTCGLPVIDENITQIHHGNLTFPSLGELGFSKGTLQRIYLGCDAMLCGHLAEKVDQSTSGSGLETLSNRFLDNVLEEMEGRNPQGWVEHIEVGPLNLHSSGVRSFGFRFQTEIGQFYLMAEIPSRAELDLAKEGEVLRALAATYLPKGWISFQEMKFSGEIENFLIFLRKSEVDINVEVPAEKDMHTVNTGILLENTTFNGERVMLVSMDVSGPDGKTLKTGDTIRARVGIQDRAITFTSSYLGTGDYPIAGDASIKCVYFSLPTELRVEQRRRAFRINTLERIPVEIACLTPHDDDAEVAETNLEESSIRGRLADLSFSGARIIADQDKLMRCVDENSHVSCRVFFPDEAEPLEIMGIIRRATVRLTDRDTQQNEIGLEFLVSEEDDREALEFIRQYVLSQQRVWLSQRIHVAGVEQW
jgi:c-di-GMP-binding flagellar brake protein YcgR